MDDFSFSFSHLDILFQLVKSLMKFDMPDGDCSLPLPTLSLLMKSDTLDGGLSLLTVCLSQDPVYSKKYIYKYIYIYIGTEKERERERERERESILYSHYYMISKNLWILV